MGSNLLLEKIVTHKVALMELFDAIFGHNGYSGIAFQQYQQRVNSSQPLSDFENLAVKSKSPDSKEGSVRLSNQEQIDNLINLQKRTKNLVVPEESSSKS